ncbi:MAG: hypothetical protein JWM90_2728, partial [Thermoleophilia bacterium]|nr:hypothetical protein [Thermoleophilia bacterium]
MSARVDITSDRSGEQGSALMVGLVIMVLGSIVIGAMMTMLDWSGERGKTRTDRAQNVSVVDRSLAAYEFALESNLTNEFHQFRLDRPAMDRLRASEASAAMGSATVVANSSFGADFRSRGLDRTWMGSPTYELSMQHTLPDGRTSWWQLVNVIAPGGQNASLVAYMRTWIAAGGPGSRVVAEPRIARAELRPGRFSDYQMLVDGPIIVSGGTDVRGRIHTNGYPDAYLVDAFTNANGPLVLGNALGSPRCFAGAGFSTARGNIVGSCTGFSPPRDEANERFIDLLRGGEHLKLMKSMCGTMVFCPGGTGPWNIDLSSNTVNGSGIPGAAKAVYVEGEASLRGQTTRQITIGVAGRSGSYGAFGSAALSLRGGAVGSTGAGIVGLVVEGDIVPRIDLGD